MLHRLPFLVCLLFAAAALAAEPPTKAHLRADGTLMVDGEPVFPLMITSATLRGENCAMLADVGFNMVTNGGDTEDSFFDAAEAAGLLVLAPHYNWATFRGNNTDLDFNAHEAAGFELTQTYKDQIGRSIAQNLTNWSGRPGVMGWVISEEPKAAYAEALEFMYEYIKSRSPAHLVTQISAEPVWYHLFRNSTDVLIVDAYPYRPGDAAQPEVSTYEIVKHAREVLPNKAVWVMAQGGNMWKNREDFPPMELAQFRNQAYLALIAGAKGYSVFSAATVDHFGQLDDAEAQAQWNKLRIVLGELKQLSPVLCDGRVADDVRLSWRFPNGQGQPPLTRVLDYYGDKYLLVANLDDEPVKIQVLGTNYGHPEAYAAEVLTNAEHLRAEGAVAGRTAETVNEAKEGKFPVLTIAPRQSGAFKLTRLPAK